MAQRPQIIRRFRLDLYRMSFHKTLTNLPIVTDSTNTNQIKPIDETHSENGFLN